MRNVELQAPCRVSIIINNYNYGAFLKYAIESALAQTDRATQVIVVDDGSTDNSRELITRYRNALTPIFKTNGGQASALNAGFAASHGEIVIFLDSDDVLLPDTVERVTRAFHANPAAAKVEYRMEIIDAHSTRTGKINPAPHLSISSGDLRAQVLAFPFDLTWMATSGNAFPARVLRQIFPIPENAYRILADFYLSHLTPLFGPVVAHKPNAKLSLVGSYPPASVRALASAEIEVLGNVPAIEPFLQQAAVIVAPLRRGGGQRIKVLQGMAHGKAVVTTPLGAEGLSGNGAEPPLVLAQDANEIADALVSLLASHAARRALGVRAREFVANHFSPEAYARRLETMYGELLTGTK